MRTIGNFEFPETPYEASVWKKQCRHRALAKNVLCVATTRVEGKWCAYCDAVPGERHVAEWYAVLRNGAKLPEGIALAVFPEFDGIPYAH